jgi:hypothetical protein
MPGPNPRYSEEQARAAIAASYSYTEALRRLGMCTSGNGRHALQRHAEEIWRISVDHFDRNARKGGGPAIPLEEIMVENSRYSNRGNLKRRLFDAGLKTRACELCGQGELWHGRRMSLILDHINGARNDHRLENLRIVCPNCNATLDTHYGRNAKIPREERPCLRCGVSFVPQYERHRYCSRECGQRARATPGPRPATRRVERPPYDQLMREIAELGYLGVGRRYGVSDNAVRKWRRAYEAAAAAAAEPPIEPAFASADERRTAVAL